MQGLRFLARRTLAITQSSELPLGSTQAICPSTPPQHTQNRTTFSELWQDALLPYLGTRLVLIIVGLLTTLYLLPLIKTTGIYPTPGKFPQVFWLMWQHFDSGFYLSIAHGGYEQVSPAGWVFYPLYPLLIAGISFLLGG